MSREVKIHDMPEEQKPLFSEGMSKLVATTIGLLLIAVIGQGLIIWKNQANILDDIADLETEVSVMHTVSDRLLQLEGSKLVGYKRLDALENTTKSSEQDKYQRGGSFRKNDADKMRVNLETSINRNSGKVAATEWKLDNLNSRVLESIKETKSTVTSLEKSIINVQLNIKSEHEGMRKEILENSTEDNTRYNAVQERLDISAKALISLNNEFESYRLRIDKIVRNCEEATNEFNNSN